MPRRGWTPIPLLLTLMAASGCRPTGPGEHLLSTILGSPSERTTRPYCVPDGPRVPSALFRLPTWCTVHYREGNAIWRRDAQGNVLTGGRMWVLHYEDSLRWPHLRDSVAEIVSNLANAGVLCFDELPVGISGRATTWLVSGYRLDVTRFTHEALGPGGYQLQLGMTRDSACTPSSRPPA
jgi:hypothetical protein